MPETQTAKVHENLQIITDALNSGEMQRAARILDAFSSGRDRSSSRVLAAVPTHVYLEHAAAR